MTKNYRGRFGPGEGGLIKRPNIRRTVEMQDTKHKAVMAWIASTVAVLLAFGIPVPDWVQGETMSWVVTLVVSLLGGGAVGWLTYLIPNRPQR